MNVAILSCNIYPINSLHVNLLGNDTSAGVPRSRVGQISHRVVLGGFNVGDPGEATGYELSRVCSLFRMELILIEVFKSKCSYCFRIG